MDYIADKLAIQDLCIDYAYYIDMFKVEEWVDCFTDDATFDETDLGNGVQVGREKLLGFADTLTRRVHLVIHLMSNHVIRDQTSDSARGEAFAVVEVAYANGERYRNHVRYVDDYRKLGGRWKFAKRVAWKTFPRETLDPMALPAK